MISNLYINRVSLAKEITHGNYLRDLPVVKNLKKMDGIRLTKNVTFLVGENGSGGKLISSYGGVSLHKQSHGESFMALVENRFGGNGLYILDEPEKMVRELLGDCE